MIWRRGRHGVPRSRLANEGGDLSSPFDLVDEGGGLGGIDDHVEMEEHLKVREEKKRGERREERREKRR